MTKKKILTLAMCVAMAAILAVGTLAYFTAEDSATNTFTVGKVDIELTEPNWVEPETVEPAITYPKDPTVQNIGINTCYVRVNVTLSDWDAFSTAANEHGITDLATIFGGHNEDQWKLTSAPVVDAVNDTVTYSYYFLSTLAKDEYTSPLFTSVTIPAKFTSEEMSKLGDDFTIEVTADAIQADGFDSVEAAFAAYDAT